MASFPPRPSQAGGQKRGKQVLLRPLSLIPTLRRRRIRRRPQRAWGWGGCLKSRRVGSAEGAPPGRRQHGLGRPLVHEGAVGGSPPRTHPSTSEVHPPPRGQAITLPPPAPALLSATSLDRRGKRVYSPAHSSRESQRANAPRIAV